MTDPPPTASSPSIFFCTGKFNAFVYECVGGIWLHTAQLDVFDAEGVERIGYTVDESVCLGIFPSVYNEQFRRSGEESEHADFFFGSASEFEKGGGVV